MKNNKMKQKRPLTDNDRAAIVRLMLVGHWSGDDIDQLQGTDAYQKATKYHANQLIQSLEKRYNHNTTGVFSSEENNNISMRYLSALDTFIDRIGGLEMSNFIEYAESLEKIITEK